MVDRILQMNFAGILKNYPGAAVATILIAVAFSVFSANAILFQPIKHPKPIWDQTAADRNNSSLITGSTPIPYRRVETVSFRRDKIAVPSIRPRNNSANSPIENLIGNSTKKFENRQQTELANAQQYLHQMGLYEGDIDGLTGPKTRAAIISFQKSKKLEQTGAMSTTLLNKIAISQQTSQQLAAGNGLLRNGNSKTTVPGNAKLVTQVQIGLINFGERSIKIDGVMGNKTARAIRRFQQRFKLDVTGKPSKELIKKLVSVGALSHG